MSFVDKIENLQKKPEVIRRRVLFFTVAAVMFIIISLWIVTLKYSPKNSENQDNASVSPFNVLSGLFKETYQMSAGSVKTGFDKLKEQFKNAGQ